jgi:hypothetical protein
MHRLYGNLIAITSQLILECIKVCSFNYYVYVVLSQLNVKLHLHPVTGLPYFYL